MTRVDSHRLKIENREYSQRREGRGDLFNPPRTKKAR